MEGKGKTDVTAAWKLVKDYERTNGWRIPLLAQASIIKGQE